MRLNTRRKKSIRMLFLFVRKCVFILRIFICESSFGFFFINAARTYFSIFKNHKAINESYILLTNFNLWFYLFFSFEIDKICIDHFRFCFRFHGVTGELNIWHLRLCPGSMHVTTSRWPKSISKSKAVCLILFNSFNRDYDSKLFQPSLYYIF